VKDGRKREKRGKEKEEDRKREMDDKLPLQNPVFANNILSQDRKVGLLTRGTT